MLINFRFSFLFIAFTKDLQRFVSSCSSRQNSHCESGIHADICRNQSTKNKPLLESLQKINKLFLNYCILRNALERNFMCSNFDLKKCGQENFVASQTLRSDFAFFVL